MAQSELDISALVKVLTPPHLKIICQASPDKMAWELVAYAFPGPGPSMDALCVNDATISQMVITDLKDDYAVIDLVKAVIEDMDQQLKDAMLEHQHNPTISTSKTTMAITLDDINKITMPELAKAPKFIFNNDLNSSGSQELPKTLTEMYEKPVKPKVKKPKVKVSAAEVTAKKKAAAAIEGINTTATKNSWVQSPGSSKTISDISYKGMYKQILDQAELTSKLPWKKIKG